MAGVEGDDRERRSHQDSSSAADNDTARNYGNPSFSTTEECLWLRLFEAVESHTRPCRTEPQQGPTKPELVPLETAVSAVLTVFGQDSGATPGAGADAAAVRARGAEVSTLKTQSRACR